MPYTKQIDRNKIDLQINELAGRIHTKGDLNYAICEIVAQLILRDGGHRLSYTTVSNWIDAVHGAERELTRRLLNPYEDKKILENGELKTFAKLLALLDDI
jgi:hypothetical protein